MRSIPALVARVVGVAMASAVLMVAPGSVAAHTDFDYSLPTEGASVDEPVSEVTVAFTLPVTLVGNGFEVLDPQENLLMPFAVTDDNTVFRLQFDPPLAGGDVGVRYSVTAEDGHVLSGAFSFTVSVDAPPPTTTTVAPTTLPAVTEPPITEAPITEPPTDQPTTTVAVAAPVETVVDATAESPASETADEADADGSSNSGVFIAIAAIVVVLAAGFVLVRSRRSAGS